MILRWILCGLLGFVFLLVASGNALVPWRHYICKDKKVPSMVPVFGGVAGAVALLLCPVAGTNWYAWIPLLLDVGCLPSLVCWLWFVAKGGHRQTP